MNYPKVRQLGDRFLVNLWNAPVEITEKVDGSQYKFYKDECGKRFHYSKGTKLVVGEQCTNLFKPTVNHMEKVGDLVYPNVWLFGEALKEPRHNVLKYDKVPEGHLALWGAFDENRQVWLTHYELTIVANQLGVDTVPLIEIYSSRENGRMVLNYLDRLLERESFLGGTKIEGLVFKNYDYSVPENHMPFLVGKYVSDKFKEVAKVKIKAPRTSKINIFIESFRTEARWRKAIQHLRDSNQLTYTPKDIGVLLQEIHKDIVEEESDNIKEWLYRYYIKDIKKDASRGFPEFYKRWLVENGS